jgi:hypothetical protein
VDLFQIIGSIWKREILLVGYEQVEPEKMADLCLIDGDILDVDPHEIG